MLFSKSKFDGSGELPLLTLDCHVMSRQNIPLLEKKYVDSLCATCPGLTGGCSPFAPRFDKLYPSYPNFVLFVLSIDFAYGFLCMDSPCGIQYKTPGPGIRRLNITTIGAINQMMKSVPRRLHAGNCKSCKKDYCTVLKGKVCCKPDRRTFSMEATNVDCDSLNKRLYNSSLSWYLKGVRNEEGQKLFPKLTRRYFGFFAGVDKKEDKKTIQTILTTFEAHQLAKQVNCSGLRKGLEIVSIDNNQFYAL